MTVQTPRFQWRYSACIILLHAFWSKHAHRLLTPKNVRQSVDLHFFELTQSSLHHKPPSFIHTGLYSLEKTTVCEFYLSVIYMIADRWPNMHDFRLKRKPEHLEKTSQAYRKTCSLLWPLILFCKKLSATNDKAQQRLSLSLVSGRDQIFSWVSLNFISPTSHQLKWK